MLVREEKSKLKTRIIITPHVVNITITIGSDWKKCLVFFQLQPVGSNEFSGFVCLFLFVFNTGPHASLPCLSQHQNQVEIFLNNVFVVLYFRLIAFKCHVLFSTGSQAIRNNHTLIHQACHSSQPAVPTQIKQDVGMAAHNGAIIMFVISI